MKIYHKHHIVPRHMGGTDDEDNLVRLTIEEHALAHLELYVAHGKWQDLVAWSSLSGQVTHAEANWHANVFRVLGIPKSPEHRKRLSEAKMGKPMSPETRRKMSESKKGKKLSAAHRKAIALGQKGRVIPREVTERQIATNAANHGTPIVIDDQLFPSQSQAGRYLADRLGLTMEAARGRIRNAQKRGLFYLTTAAS